LSGSTVSAGLNVLADRGLVERWHDGRSSYRLANYNPDKGWAMFPARGLYYNDTITAFDEFRLRLPAELEALKLYFLFASRRTRRTNLAFLSYEKIQTYSGVPRNSIKRALSLLSANSLVYVERLPSKVSDKGVANAYRLVHLDPRRHMGTAGRAMDTADTQSTPASDFASTSLPVEDA